MTAFGTCQDTRPDHALTHAQATPTPNTIRQGFVATLCVGSIVPAEAVTSDIDNATDDAAILHRRYTVG